MDCGTEDVRMDAGEGVVVGAYCAHSFVKEIFLIPRLPLIL
jgi:hypothetical protein